MLDINYIRENKDQVAQAAKNKNRQVDLDVLLALDDQRRDTIRRIQLLREERNNLSKNSNPDEVRERGRQIKEDLKILETALRDIDEQYSSAMLFVPNVPLDDAPIGKDETQNVEIGRWGEIRNFSFEPKNHTILGDNLDGIDMIRGSKISGFRGYFLKGPIAQLQFAILFYVFQKLAGKGYIPIIAPSVIKEFTLFGSAHFPWGKDSDVYKLQGEGDEDLFLSGTAEIPVTAYHSGEVLSHTDLPKKFVALSPCFRREHGAYGRDTKGILRVHEFWKIEQVILAEADIHMARQLHNELQQNTEEIMQDFELPYHVLNMCTGDMGEPQMLKYDTEVWIPSENKYREIGSNSIMGDFQARRLNIRYKDAEGEVRYCYTLNDTAIPSTRALIAIMENHQQEDGSISIPKVLQPLTGFDTIKPL